MSKIGIMGGTFDPIHNGHMQLAEQAFKQQKLDKILFIPNHIPWMKKDRKITDEVHRLEMVRLAIEAFPSYELSTVEIETGGNSYTFRTLETLRKQYPKDEFYFILGADSLFSIESWVHPEKIMEYAVILVAVRDDCDMQKLTEQSNKLISGYHARIFTLHMPPIDISSTRIREQFYTDQMVEQMLPAKVAAYIREHHLYYGR
ncbi:MAG: nicotinate-nucleotide adenylyltransferase [Lachnospiraceae bacterium]